MPLISRRNIRFRSLDCGAGGYGGGAGESQNVPAAQAENDPTRDQSHAHVRPVPQARLWTAGQTRCSTIDLTKRSSRPARSNLNFTRRIRQFNRFSTCLPPETSEK